MGLRFTSTLLYFYALSICCIHPVYAESASAPIVIGVVHAKAHPSAESMRKSFDMAVETKNREGGVKGRPLQLVYADDGLQARGSIGYQHGDEERAVKSLADLGAVMLMGGYSSANTIHQTSTSPRPENIPKR